MLISCRGSGGADGGVQENVLTMSGDTVTRYESEAGRLSSHFYTPLMEEYKYAPEPYVEYRRGIDIITYDSLGNVKSTFVASYAINFTNLKLWETKGSVVVRNEEDGRWLETEQLFWNQATRRIYSNVDTNFHLGGDDIINGSGFESDEDLENWEIRSSRGRLNINVEPTRDTTAVAQDSTVQAGADPHQAGEADGQINTE